MPQHLRYNDFFDVVQCLFANHNYSKLNCQFDETSCWITLQISDSRQYIVLKNVKISKNGIAETYYKLYTRIINCIQHIISKRSCEMYIETSKTKMTHIICAQEKNNVVHYKLSQNTDSY